ncbi:MAG TPA: cupin domain-containing protein [Nitrolancea sp.]|nr:cupin domain-containing protein [Nitrolancea sp.]
METRISEDGAKVFARPSLENSIWYGSALISLLATAEMTGGRYALQLMRMQKGFTPPAPHRHGPEDFYILRGQLRFWVGSDQLVANAGDFVRTPPGIWHTLQDESDEAEFLAIFAPSGMEGFFQSLGSPAEELVLPDGRVGPPDPSRLRALGPGYGIEFAPPGTTTENMGQLP